MDKVRKFQRATFARVSLLLALLALAGCVTLFASGCSRSHVQETVTVAPRPAATQSMTVANSNPAAPAVDADAEAAGDALAHAIIALKTRRRDEALYYMNLARTRLTHCLNRTATDAKANSNPTRERLIIDLRELDAAERLARHNEYQQSRAQLHSISDELDRLNSSLTHSLN